MPGADPAGGIPVLSRAERLRQQIRDWGMLLYVTVFTITFKQSLDREADGLIVCQARNPASTTGKFLGLEDQTGRAERKDLEHVDLAANDVEPTTTSGGQPTCATEDHSFMERKPGGPDTLPGWKAAKNILNA